MADNISPLVDTGFSMQAAYLSAIDVWTLAFLFGFQIYYDFSAYSYIAIGAAQIFGVSIPINFNYPYVANLLKISGKDGIFHCLVGLEITYIYR